MYGLASVVRCNQCKQPVTKHDAETEEGGVRYFCTNAFCNVCCTDEQGKACPSCWKPGLSVVLEAGSSP